MLVLCIAFRLHRTTFPLLDALVSRGIIILLCLTAGWRGIWSCRRVILNLASMRRFYYLIELCAAVFPCSESRNDREGCSGARESRDIIGRRGVHSATIHFNTSWVHQWDRVVCFFVHPFCFWWQNWNAQMIQLLLHYASSMVWTDIFPQVRL